MIRLFNVALVLCLITTGLLGVVVLIGHRQPVPEYIQNLHLTDCAPPCWIGIVPGVTTLEDANARLIDFYGESLIVIPIPNGGGILKDKDSCDYMAISFSSLSNDDIVREIRFTSWSPKCEQVSVSDVFSVLEPPDIVDIAGNTYIPWGADITKYGASPMDGVTVAYYCDPSRSALDWNRQIIAMDFFNYAGTNRDAKDGPSWRGFASLARYGLSP